MGALLSVSKCFESCRFKPITTGVHPDEQVVPEAPQQQQVTNIASVPEQAPPSTLFNLAGKTSAPIIKSGEDIQSGELQKTEVCRSPPSGLYGSAAKLFHSFTISEEAWNAVITSVKENPVGAYLLYSPANNGTWQCMWSRELVESAWAFSRPAVPSEIPGYKFSGSKKESLATGIHSSTESLCQGWVDFIKMARKHNGSFVFLPNVAKVENRELLPHFVITLHDSNTQQVHVARPGDPEILTLSVFDAVGAVAGQRGPAAIAELIGSKISPTALATTANRHGRGLVFLEGI